MPRATLFGRPLPDGGTIGVPATSSPYFNRSEVLRGVEWWESMGYHVKLGRSVWAQDDYVALHSAGKSYLKQQPIASLEAMLDPAVFVRIHRSFVVRLDRIARIEPYAKESKIAILHDGARLAVSRTGYARLLEAMGDSQGNRSSTR